MIVLDDESSPRWLKELARFLPLKNLIFVQGNVLDLLSYSIQSQTQDGTSILWTENTLPLFFRRLLEELGYDVVGLFDPVDGLSFALPEMEQTYKQLSSGKRPVSTASASGPRPAVSLPPTTVGYQEGESSTIVPTQGRASAEPPEEQPPPQGMARSREMDLNSAFDGIRAALRNTCAPCAFVFNLASRLVTSPGHLTRDERVLFTKVLKASTECADVHRDGLHWKNVMIFICDKLNDLPAFLYLNNPRARSIFIDKPDRLARSRLFRRSYTNFHGVEPSSECPAELTSQFASLTDGMSNHELKSLGLLSRREKVPVKTLKDVQKLCERYKYGITESEWDKIDRTRLDRSEEFIRERIKGQDLAIARVLDIVKRAKIGLAAGSGVSSRPRGVLFFAGPTGVGKTELAKSLAELLFGQQDRCIRFDMSEYASQHADQRLLGAPPGYVGYEEGGQLTTAIREKPFSVLLFDEIEKAHGSIFDKFLQILDDGRLTDGKGETVYFSESIIVFTSNLGTVSQTAEEGEETVAACMPPYERMQESVLKAIRDHFNHQLGRPEILNRFGDNFVVFDFIRPPVEEQIIDLLLKHLTERAMESHKIALSVAPEVREKLIAMGRGNLRHGGRGLRNVVDSAMVNPLNRALFDCSDIEEGSTVRVVDLLDHGITASYRFELRIETDRKG
ncbi:AAA family ATPase [Desulforhabdus sp. TSK]|uniref:AAA family ATPase n=1 Tax=Desulforhabdus sp. TSK TaxID=2925014 RepID=UPI001FC7BD23|nr:AAA family ATPase [Desulforhabdus sp. TSK]GKT09131.1 chaperone [Desulforhabdus sp. TSK]